MNNVCKQMEVEYQNPTIMDLIAEIDRLTQELTDAKVENYMLRNDNEALHNRDNKYDTVVDGNEDLSYVDEYAKGYDEEDLAKSYEITSEDFKFGGHDIKDNK